MFSAPTEDPTETKNSSGDQQESRQGEGEEEEEEEEEEGDEEEEYSEGHSRQDGGSDDTTMTMPIITSEQFNQYLVSLIKLLVGEKTLMDWTKKGKWWRERVNRVHNKV